MTELEQAEYEFHAKQLLDNPVFINTLESINKDIGLEMDMVKPDNLKQMQALVLLRQASTKIITHVVLAAESGKITEFNAKTKRKLFR